MKKHILYFILAMIPGIALADSPLTYTFNFMNHTEDTLYVSMVGSNHCTLNADQFNAVIPAGTTHLDWMVANDPSCRSQNSPSLAAPLTDMTFNITDYSNDDSSDSVIYASGTMRGKTQTGSEFAAYPALELLGLTNSGPYKVKYEFTNHTDGENFIISKPQ